MTDYINENKVLHHHHERLKAKDEHSLEGLFDQSNSLFGFTHAPFHVDSDFRHIFNQMHYIGHRLVRTV